MPVSTVLIKKCVQLPVAQTIDSASNVEKLCKGNRVGNSFAAEEGSLSFSRSVMEHHVRKPTALQSSARVLNS